jgi:glycogen debranching enzyme
LMANELLEQSVALEKDAADHYSDLLGHALQIETPDADTNRALAWSEIALDQAWVCDSDLGCGIVAGYGPSRKARRPQYDWFFAGDGMVATRALLAAGEYQQARQELEFILKYQDHKTGMIWHELSQSAGWLDWSKYPYMYLHTDLTFDFLNTVAEYFSITGDHDFVSSHWTAIQAAHQYCRSLLDPNDGLPRIPSGHRGQREQDELTDELTLSASWATALEAFANLAAATGHNQAADEARTASRQAVDAINQRYWDDSRKFWISGYNRSGTPLIDRNLGPAGVLETPLFSAAQRNSLLNQLASSDFQTDWGTRGRASNANNYSANSYASGSVWATGTAGVAQAFWTEHRPVTALPIWSALVPWSSLDSLGHMHEALAGDFYHEEIESVPEQTWSSATFFTAAVNGLLGLQVDGVSRQVTLVPHLPPEWNAVTVRNLQVGSSVISFHILQSTGEVRLQMKNEGPPVGILFDPELPLGAKLRATNVDGNPATLEAHEQDTHAKVKFNLPHGDMSLTLAYTGGVAIVPERPRLLIGEPSKATKITGMRLSGQMLIVDYDFLPSASSGFELRTPWKIQNAQGATLETVSPGLYRLHLGNPATQKAVGVYQHGQLTLSFVSTD